MSAIATPMPKSRWGQKCNTVAARTQSALCSPASSLSSIEQHHHLQGFDKDHLAEAVRGCDLVIIPAGVPRKPGMTRDDLFKVGLHGIILSVMHSGVAGHIRTPAHVEADMHACPV